MCADFDALQPVRTTAPNFTTEVANAAGTTINPAEDYAQGSTTSGENGVLAQGATTTAAPTYTTATTNPLSLTTAGALRTDSSATTQPVSGTVTANQGTPNTAANKWPIEIVDSGGVNVASVNASNELLTTDTDLTLAQGSTTSGQLGPLVQGAVTTSSPTYTTGQTSPLSLDTSGNLRVVTSGTVSVTPVLTYFTDTAVASGSTVTHSLAGPVTLDKIDGSASGEIKMTIAIGVTGSEVTYWNGFSSASKQDISFKLVYGYVIPTGSSAKVTIKNRDTSAQDTYLTFFSH
jgi:hypothetical protein